MDLCNRAVVNELLEKYSLAPRKSYGQNFLINPSIPELIAEKSAEQANSSPCGVIEIGPGIGALTSRLARYYDKVVAIEIDRGLIDLLEETLAGEDNVEVIFGDFMDIDLPALIDEKFHDIISDGGTVGVCANLPYYITTPVIMKILDSFSPSSKIPLSSITIMIQLEVANRLCSAPGSSDYGSITAAIDLQAKARKLFNVSAGNFYPVPKVASSVVSIVPHGGIREIVDFEIGDAVECEAFLGKVKDVIAMAFGQRRKTLTNSLSKKYAKDKIASALSEMGLREDVRGEKLSAKEFCILTRKLQTYCQ